MTNAYKPHIDGLRAVAVSIVVLFHAFPSWVPGGFVGVDVFFVISGYLITGIIASEMEQERFSLSRFYARRAKRIFPALATVLLATLAIGGWGFLPNAYKSLGLHTVAGALFVPNLLLWNEAGYFDAAASWKPLLHLWSLGIEEQFYLFWPALFYLKMHGRASLGVLLIVLISSFAYSVYATNLTPTAAFYSPLSRLWELGVGGILAVSRISLPRFSAIIGLAAIFASAVLLNAKSSFPGILALIPVTGSALVIISRNALLEHRWVAGLGLISYPLYLWHWPLLSIATNLQLNSPAMNGGLVISSILLSVLTYQYIEKPVRSGRVGRAAVPISVAVIAASAFAGTYVYLAKGFPERFSKELLAMFDQLNKDHLKIARFPQCWLLQQPYTAFADECRRGSILIWGDSHAAQLYPGLVAVTGKDVAQLTRSSCMPIQIDSTEPCYTSNALILEQIRNQPPETVILFAAWTSYQVDYEAPFPHIELLRKSLRGLQSAGVKKIILLGPAPFWLPSLLQNIYNRWIMTKTFPDYLQPSYGGYKNLDRQLAALAAEEGAQFISVYDALCDERGCLTHAPSSKSDLLTYDRAHFTAAGAEHVVRLLGIGSFAGKLAQ